MMDKDEILKKSREENKGVDAVEKQTMLLACQRSVMVGGLVCMVICLIDAIFFNRFTYSVWGVYLSITGTNLLVKFFYRRKLHELIIGILQLVLAVVLIVMYFVRAGA